MRSSAKPAALPPRLKGGDMRSRRVEERSADILALWEGRKDISLEELRLALTEEGLAISVGGLHRFFARRGMTRKKDWVYHRKRPARGPEAAPRLVRRSDRSRSGTPGLHQRDMDCH